MYVVAQHTIRNWDKAMERGQPLFNPPAGITLHYFLPNVDRTNAVCLWEADSLETIRHMVDSTLGDSTRNEFFVVDTAYASGLNKQVMEASTGAM